jgi:hypothetical protein
MSFLKFLLIFLLIYRFAKGLPRDKDLDGELFGGRGKFQSTISIVKAGVEEWKNITYEVRLLFLFNAINQQY